MRPTPTEENKNSASIEDGNHRVTALRRIWEEVEQGKLDRDFVISKQVPEVIRCLTTKKEADDYDIITWCECM